MKWTLLSRNGPRSRWCLESAAPFTELKYDGSLHSFRLSTPHRQLYFLEKKSRLSKVLSLRTAYNFEHGAILNAPEQNEGLLHFHFRKYLYRVDNDRINLFTTANQLMARAWGDFTSVDDHWEKAALLFAFAAQEAKHLRPYPELDPLVDTA